MSVSYTHLDVYKRQAKGTVNPRVFIDRLAKKMPANVTVVADVGQNQIWTCPEYKFRKEGRLLTSVGMGTMGYSCLLYTSRCV